MCGWMHLLSSPRVQQGPPGGPGHSPLLQHTPSPRHGSARLIMTGALPLILLYTWHSPEWMLVQSPFGFFWGGQELEVIGCEFLKSGGGGDQAVNLPSTVRLCCNQSPFGSLNET